MYTPDPVRSQNDLSLVSAIKRWTSKILFSPAIEMEYTRIQSGGLAVKITAIASGEAHSLALTGDGNVYTWGRGMFGRLGNGKETDELSPVLVEFGFNELTEEKPKFVGIAAGAYHSLALAGDGSIWCWGYGILILDCDMDGQLGVDGENLSVPTLLKQLTELNSSNVLEDDSERTSETSFKVRSVKAGGMLSLAIDNRGILWMWGNCPIKISDGEFSLQGSSVPIPVSHFHGRIVVEVACGSEHIVALVSPGESEETGDNLLCYSWGINDHGQLGLGHKISQSEPQLVKTFDHESDWSVYQVACGAYHTALLTRRRQDNNTSESLCWTFGLGRNGQLGRGTTQTSLLPEPIVDLPQKINLISIDCGLFHTSVVSRDGCVWSWGMEKGLGLCPDAGSEGGDALTPLIVPNHAQKLKFDNPVQIACGAAHTLLLSSNGYKLWSWGRGRNGALGNSQTRDSYAPTLVSWPPLLSKNEEKAEKFNENQNVDEEQDTRLNMAMEEITLLKSKLNKMERYTSMLHGSIFGTALKGEEDIPVSFENRGSFDIAKEWDGMLESADRSKLLRLEMFYRNMLAGVKDKMMKKRIQEIVKECLESSNSTTNNLY